MRRVSFAVALLSATMMFSLTFAAAAGEAKGTLTYKGTTAALKYAELVRGPDAVDPTTIIRRLVLSTSDLSAKLKACDTMSCADGLVTEGMTVEFVDGPRLNYWVALKGGQVQYSGTNEPDALTATTDEPDQLAGTLTFDDTAADGPKVDVRFAAQLVKEFRAAP